MSVDYSDIDDMMGGGGISAYLQRDPEGSVFEGPITHIGKKQQQIDYKTKKPRFFDDGKPMVQIPVTIKTERRDPDTPGDDGSRTLYLKGRLFSAVKQAARDAGNAKLRIGGYLWTKHTGYDGDAKVYEAKYTPAPDQATSELDAMMDAAPASIHQNVAANVASVLGTPAPQQTQASSIAAKLAAATAPAPAANPLLADLTDAQKAAIKNLTPEQAAGAGLEQQWNALQG